MIIIYYLLSIYIYFYIIYVHNTHCDKAQRVGAPNHVMSQLLLSH